MSNRFHNKFHRHNHHTDTTDPYKYPDSAYDPIASRESPFKGEFYSLGDITTTESFSAGGNVYGEDGSFTKNLYVSGNANVYGEDVYLYTKLHVTSATDITYTGNQAAFTIGDGTNYFLYVKGNTFEKPKYIGVGTSDPIEKFTVVGNISSSGIIYEKDYSSLQWNSVYTTVCSTSSQWTSAYQSIEALQQTLTAFSSVSGQIGQIKDFIPTITVNAATSTVLIQHFLNVTSNVNASGSLTVGGSASITGSLSVNSDFGFSTFRTLSVNYTNANNQVFAIPSNPANDLVIITNDDFTPTSNVATISAFSGGRAGGFFILTNGMSANTVEILKNENINLRGSNTISLTLSYGDSCCMRCRDSQVVSIW